jgi:hypothetical protein
MPTNIRFGRLTLPRRTFLAGKNADGEVGQLRGGRLGAPFARDVEQPRLVKQPVEEPRRVAENLTGMLEVDVDPAVEDARDGDVVVVGAEWGVERDEGDAVAEALQGGGQGVVAHAAPAVHARGAGGENGDVQGAESRRG